MFIYTLSTWLEFFYHELHQLYQCRMAWSEQAEAAEESETQIQVVCVFPLGDFFFFYLKIPLDSTPYSLCGLHVR